VIRALDKWLPGAVRAVWRRPKCHARPRHLCFCIADHYEPFGRGNDAAAARAQVSRWAERLPAVLNRVRDADGRPAAYTFFYPAETDDAQCLDGLAGLVARGHAEVEIHLHHRHDTRDGLRVTLEGFRDALRSRHGLLGSDADGTARYGFIHGNWALCNSRPDGDWCGVNAELGVLEETGCYADFTFPSAPSPTQPRTVNAIYYAQDRPDGLPRGHDHGIEAAAGRQPGPGLLLVQGPLALEWRRRKWGLLPRLENAELTAVNPPTPLRNDRWSAQCVHVRGRPEWVFVKVHTHGCVPANESMLLGGGLEAGLRDLAARYNDGHKWRLHFVTARELANLVRAAEDGHTGDPGAYRNHWIAPPPMALQVERVLPKSRKRLRRDASTSSA
jgi:hypothetical protein